MPSTTSHPKVVIPRTLVLGSSGRLGTILRQFWGADAATWASRVTGPGKVVVHPLCDTARLRDMATDHDIVLCLAGVPPGRGALPLNTDLACSAVAAAAQTRHRMVFLCSSSAVYGGAPFPMDEGFRRAPVSAYGREKVRMEEAALDLARMLGVRVCHLRIGNVAGADAILGGWKPGFQLDIDAAGSSPLRSYIGPRDLAGVMSRLLLRWRMAPTHLNVALPGAVALRDLLTGAGLPWINRAAGPDTIGKVVLDVTRLNRIMRLPDPGRSTQRVLDDWRGLTAQLVAA